jgi:hypothetical protein
MLNPKLETPAFAEAPARCTRHWQAGLRAGRLNSKQTQMSLPTGVPAYRQAGKAKNSRPKTIPFEFHILDLFRI